MQFEGKKGLIIGVANDRSIAQQIMNQGGNVVSPTFPIVLTMKNRKIAVVCRS